MEDGLDRLICAEVRELIRNPVSVGLPSRCDFDGCGAIRRLVGEQKVGGSWRCPLCGIALPYAFWKVHTEPGVRIVKPEELILQLADGACQVCGELPECRCDRMLMGGVKDGEQL